MQVLIDWEDPIARTHILAVATIGGIAGRRHMVRVPAETRVETIMLALEEWASASGKVTSREPSSQESTGDTAGSKHSAETK